MNRLKSVFSMDSYTAADLRKDLIAGLTVGVIAIPLGMAFAIASGVEPVYGIYTTIIAGIIISLFGGSRFQIGGPTGAFVPVLLGIVTMYGYQNLLAAGMLAGVFLVIMGLLRLGSLIRFIPKPVTIGFTAGIAVTIFSGQIGNFFGLTGLERHEHFLPNMAEIGTHLYAMNGYSIVTAGICFASLLLLPKFKLTAKVPPSIAGMLISTLAASLLFPGKVATIGSTYGGIPDKLPTLQWPNLSFSNLQDLIGPALVITMLGAIESLLSAVVADGMSGTRHNSNKELIGQGLANIAAPLFGGIPATGAIARTAANIRSGAVSRLSGVIHGVVVLLVLLAFAPYASLIPLASMAPILMMVAWNMSERKEFAKLFRTRSSDTLILTLTFLLTVFTDLTMAVEVGIGAAIILFVRNMAVNFKVEHALPDQRKSSLNRKLAALTAQEDSQCAQAEILQVDGPLFFGNIGQLDMQLQQIRKNPPEYVILRMKRVPFMDTSGASLLTHWLKDIYALGSTVLVTGLGPQPIGLLQKTIPEHADYLPLFFSRTGEALQYTMEHAEPSRCQGCPHRYFQECDGFASPTAAPSSKGRPAQALPAVTRVRRKGTVLPG